MPSVCCLRVLLAITFALALIGGLSACIRSVPVPAPAPQLTVPVTEPTVAPTVTANASPTPLPPVEPQLLAVPPAFRFEVTMKPVGAPGAPDESSAPEVSSTMIKGQYRDGMWSQSARHGNDTVEEFIVAPDPQTGLTHSYTRAAGDETWTRWPGVGFDASYGLASPFTVLRLYPLDRQKTRGEIDLDAGAPEPVVKVEAVFPPETIRRLLDAGVSAVAGDAETRAALQAQLEPMVVTQTITYWATEDDRIYRAAATLLARADDGQPVPSLEVTWQFSDYEDPSIAVAAPAEFADVSELMTAPEPTPEPDLDPATTLRVRVFSDAGVLAGKATVTVYPPGQRQALDSREAADAQFALPPGVYDVQVRAEGAEQWLKDLQVLEGSVNSQDVVFEFGTLTVTVTQDGATPQVDIVIYPAGQRQTMAAWRTENPTTVLLPAGAYDVEVALPDFTGSKIVTDVQVEAGKTTEQVIDLGE